MIEVHEVKTWYEQNKESFTPPVCNKLMFDDQLTVFFVGGPNQRKDYHIEEGEELFLQMKGDMCLKVVEKGKFKDVVIKEGEMFLLPSRIQHSPQRFLNTLGLVVERRRNVHEKDCVRYFMEGSNQALFERWFHLEDIVKDLPPLIKTYFDSEAHRTGQPTDDSVVLADRSFEPDEVTSLQAPFNLSKWLENNAKEIESIGSKVLYGNPDFKTEVVAYGSGSHKLTSFHGETLVIQQQGNSVLIAGDNVFAMGPKSLARVPPEISFEMVQEPRSFGLSVRMATPIA